MGGGGVLDVRQTVVVCAILSVHDRSEPPSGPILEEPAQAGSPRPRPLLRCAHRLANDSGFFAVYAPWFARSVGLLGIGHGGPAVRAFTSTVFFLLAKQEELATSTIVRFSSVVLSAGCLRTFSSEGDSHGAAGNPEEYRILA